MDTHEYKASALSPRREEQPETPRQGGIAVHSKPSRATKQKDLSSNIMGTAGTTAARNDEAANTLVDYDLSDLPKDATTESVKKIAKVKHVIEVVVDSQSITGQCTGSGRIKMRLGPEENADDIKIMFVKQGINISEHTNNTNKKSGFTTE
jgi:hypothetical protein